MKTKSIVTTLAVLVMTTVLALAKDPVDPKLVVVNQKGTNVFKVIYEGAQKGDVTLNIFSKDGKQVFTETIKRVDGFIRPLNFAGMAYGEYTLVVTDDAGKTVRSMSYQIDTPINKIHVAKIGDQNKYLLSIPNKGKDVIHVRILDKFENVVHQQNLAFKDDFGLVYSFKNVIGEPTFELTDQFGNVRRIKL